MQNFVAIVIVIVFYLLPSFVAAVRHHHNEGAIVALNILAGWTILGWIAALVWALTNAPRHEAAARARR